jgi:hypothetical protein
MASNKQIGTCIEAQSSDFIPHNTKSQRKYCTRADKRNQIIYTQSHCTIYLYYYIGTQILDVQDNLIKFDVINKFQPQVVEKVTFHNKNNPETPPSRNQFQPYSSVTFTPQVPKRKLTNPLKLTNTTQF